MAWPELQVRIAIETDDIVKALLERKEMAETLTRTQAQCTELLERARAAETELNQHGDACPGLEWHDQVTGEIQDALDELGLPHDDACGPCYDKIADSVRLTVGNYRRLLDAVRATVPTRRLGAAVVRFPEPWCSLWDLFDELSAPATPSD